MAETRRRFDPEFCEDAVRIVRETGKPVAQGARDLGINATLANASRPSTLASPARGAWPYSTGEEVA